MGGGGQLYSKPGANLKETPGFLARGSSALRKRLSMPDLAVPPH